jgi:hypothetical protein
VAASWQEYGMHTPHCAMLENARGDREYTFTGVLLMICQGTAEGWERGAIRIPLQIPHLPLRHGFAMERGAPFVTLSSLAMEGACTGMGFSVDGFRLRPEPADAVAGRPQGLTSVTIEAELGVRGAVGFAYRVGYQLVLTGRVAPLDPSTAPPEVAA